MIIDKIKKDFQIFKNNPNLIYLDSAATSLTPDLVVDTMNDYYYNYNANISRGVYKLSEIATDKYEQAREKVAKFIGASSSQIIFTSGTTASINTIAFGLMRKISKDSKIAITASEHHSNFVPWQRLVSKDRLSIIKLNKNGYIDLEDFKEKITSKTSLLTISHVSNVLGTINPIKKLVNIAKQINPEIIVIVDGAQSTPHMSIDIQDLDCDFFVFSAHKMCGPTGVGVIYGKKELLEQLTPMFSGGNMTDKVSFTETTFTQIPQKLEAGTPNIAGVIGLGAAVEYLKNIGLDNIKTHEAELLLYTQQKLYKTFGNDIIIFGPSNIKDRSGVLSFTFKNYHPHDIASILDSYSNICVRAGNHCAMPLHTNVLCVVATTRISFYIYNTEYDVDKLIEGLKEVKKILK